MALAVPEKSVDTIGSTRAQTPTLDVDQLGLARTTRDVDNTSSQPGRDRSVWHRASPPLSPHRPFTWVAKGESDWVEALVNRKSLATLSSFAFPPALRVMIDALARIAYAFELPEGWFERGSVGLSDRARSTAIDFVFRMAIDGLLAKEASLDVIPTPIGGIQFEWAGKNGEIEVEIDAQGQFYTLVTLPDGSFHETPRSDPIPATTALTQVKRILG